MEKRATVIDSIRKQTKNVLLVDAGDLFSRRPQYWRNLFIARAYRFMDYDAIALGDQDFVQGPEFLITELFVGGKILNTNIQYLGLTIGNPYKIFTFDSLRIGVTAIFDSSLAGLVWVKSKGFFKFINTTKSFKPVLDELQKKCDFIILLAHMELNKTRQFVKAFPMINLVINGHSMNLLQTPVKQGNTYFLQTDGNAYRLGKAVLYFKGKQLQKIENGLILLDGHISNHPKMMELIAEYKDGPRNRRSNISPQSKIK